VGWVIDFCNTHQFRVSKNSESANRLFQIFDTISKSKESPGLGIWKKKNQIQKTAGSEYFKNFK
jgi:hypothetical protein